MSFSKRILLKISGESLMGNSNYGLDIFDIGSTGGESIEINGITDVYVNETKKAWTNGLREKL